MAFYFDDDFYYSEELESFVWFHNGNMKAIHLGYNANELLKFFLKTFRFTDGQTEVIRNEVIDRIVSESKKNPDPQEKRRAISELKAAFKVSGYDTSNYFTNIRGVGYYLTCENALREPTDTKLDSPLREFQKYIELHCGSPFFETDMVNLSLFTTDLIQLSLPNPDTLSTSLTENQKKHLARLYNDPYISFAKRDMLVINDEPVDFNALCRKNKITNVPAFKSKLESNRLKVAINFSRGEDGNFRNDAMVGVKSSNITRDRLQYNLYKTDYFSHKVVEKTLYELYQDVQPPEFSYGNLKDQVLWRTCFGMSITVEIPFTDSTSVIILTHRSNNASYANANGIEPIYVSATEGIVPDDFKDVDIHDDITKKMILRALQEEVGISEDMVDTIKVASGFYSDFLQDNLAIAIMLKPMNPISSVDELWKNGPPSASREEVSDYFFKELQEIKELLADEETLAEKIRIGELRQQTVFTLKEHIRIYHRDN